MILTKLAIAEYLAQKIGINKREAHEITDLFFSAITEELINGVPVKLSGFGNFKLHNKKERPGRNPKTGEPVPISARRVVSFCCGKTMRALVAKYQKDE